jgi:competence protein ComEA
VSQQFLRPPPRRDWRERLGDLRAVVPLSTAGLVLAACAVAVAIVFGIAGFRLLTTPPPAELSLPRANATATQSPTTSAPGPVTVHVAGAVARPGVYRVGATARVDDAVTAAGGITAEADLDALNLAAKVADGDRVFVPRKGQAPPPVVAPVGATEGAAPRGPVNLNTATIEQLDTLPGVGPTTAQAIIAWRQEHGAFRSVQDLLQVRGIGPAKLESLREQVTV